MGIVGIMHRYNTYLSMIYIFFIDKEHVAAKERQEIELAAQRVTLQEQRTHIDILDTALTNAQGNVVRLEEEVPNSILSQIKT